MFFTLSKTMIETVFTEILVFMSFVAPSKTGKSQFFYNWQKIGIFQSKFDKINSFFQNSQPLWDVMQKEIEILQFVESVLF